jgi:hypothetical protein
LLRSLSGFFGSSQSGVLIPSEGSERSLLDLDTSAVHDTWIHEVSQQLAQDMECTKVGRNGKPYPRKLRVDSKNLMLELLGGSEGDVGVPLDGLVDVLQGLCSKELVTFHKRYRKASAEEELAKLAIVLQTPARTFSLIFRSEAQCLVVGIFVTTLLKSRNCAPAVCARFREGTCAPAIVDPGRLVFRPPEGGKAKVVYQDCSTYEGQFRNYMRHGQGVLKLSDGTTYECQWSEDKQHGAGVERCPDKSFFSGSYSRGERHGPGELTWPDGSAYVGEFARGRAHGQGVLARTDGTVYRGTFSEGCMCGEGHIEWKGSSCSYRGQFSHNSPHGQGTMLWESGDWKSYEGQWKDGLYHGMGTLVDRWGVTVSGQF